MAQHLFLTGEKGVGKSTLLKKILKELSGPIGGFFTVRRFGVFPKEPDLATVHLLRAGTQEGPSEKNLLFVCGQQDPQTKERFELLGCQALQSANEARWIVMDEVGPHEEQAQKFREAVLQILDGEVPVLGVLQKADSVFLKEIAEHSAVQVITVTEDDRESIFAVCCEILGIEPTDEQS